MADADVMVDELRQRVRNLAARVAALEAPATPAGKWYVVNRTDALEYSLVPEFAYAAAARWNKADGREGWWRAIFATSADDALAQYAAMTTGTVPAEARSQSPEAGVSATHAGAVTPPADADDAAESLLWILGGNEVSGYSVTRVRDLARAVIRQRDEARRALDVSQSTLRDALAREVDATARADAAEKDRDEARREAAHQADLVERGNQYALSVERQRDDAQREAKAAHASERAHYETATRNIARADAAEATVRELRALCEEAAESITPTAYVHTAKLAARLRAAAAGEGGREA